MNIKALLLIFILFICLITNVVSIIGYLIIIGFYALTYLYSLFEKRKNLPRYLYHILALIIILSAVILYQHLLPGFNNILIFEKIQVSQNGAPFTMYFNADKALAGLVLLLFVAPLNINLTSSFKKAWYIVIINIFLLMGLALQFNFVKFDFKFYSYFFIWGLNNLLIVCMAEEVLFRGFLQRHLSLLKIKRSDIFAISISALAFGALHWKAGIYYVIYATIAGVMYGIIYQKSKNIIFSILSHFVFNLIHIIFFTYPFIKQ